MVLAPNQKLKIAKAAGTKGQSTKGAITSLARKTHIKWCSESVICEPLCNTVHIE